MEIQLIVDNINATLKSLKNWMKDVPVDTPIMCAPAKSRLHYDPLGVVLILGAWNYPIFTTFEPLVSAIAAGNVSLIKPSENSPNTSKVIKELVDKHLSKKFFRAMEGGVDLSTHLTSLKFDLIAFTGGNLIGVEVAKAAAKNLTKCLLELGGINPCIVDETADIEFAAKKVVNGRYMNCGQICIAPDHVFVHSSVKEEFLKMCKE